MASAPYGSIISRQVAYHTAKSLATREDEPGMRRRSLQSLTKVKKKTHKNEPMAEMLRRYWMLPYQAS
ncbi:hypothetical protein ACFX1R_006098 [Malus domestica]